MKLSVIAQHLGTSIVGNEDIDIERLVHPKDAQTTRDLVLAMQADLVPLLIDSPARAAVVRTNTEMPEGSIEGYVIVDHPKVALAIMTALFRGPVHHYHGIHPTAEIAAEAQVSEEVSIGPFVVIGPGTTIGRGTIICSHVTIGAEVQIGSDCLIYSGVRIGDRVEVGQRVILHHNVSLGADGFSFVTPYLEHSDATKRSANSLANVDLPRIHSLGTVILSDDVEVGANTTIDRGTITATRIGRNTKIDNLVQIGHNVTIGESCIICGHVGIAGSVCIGDRVVLAGGVGIADQIKISDDAVIVAGSGVNSNVPAKAVYYGYPALPQQEYFKHYLNIKRVPTIRAQVAELNQQLKEIKDFLNNNHDIKKCSESKE